MPGSKELILVYNADSGFFSIIKDGIHKIVSPSTYQCNLCALTYGAVRMKDEWRTFIEKLEINAEFLHRDEFLRLLREHPHRIEDVKFPAIFLRDGERITLLIRHDEINECKTLRDLMHLITQKLSNG